MHAQNQRTGELTKMLLDLVKLDREETRLILTDTIAN